MKILEAKSLKKYTEWNPILQKHWMELIFM